MALRGVHRVQGEPLQDARRVQGPGRADRRAARRDARASGSPSRASRPTTSSPRSRRRRRPQGFEVLIVTGDRDSFQLVSEHITVLYPTKGVSELTRFTPEKVFEKYGLTPAQYPDFAALRGDPSDNLPGIPGVGEKTATKWINQFGSFAELVERAEEVKGKAGQNFRDHLEAVKLNRRLTEMVRDVELPKRPRAWSARRTTARPLAMVLDTLEIRNPGLRERLLRRRPGRGGGATPDRRPPRASRWTAR